MKTKTLAVCAIIFSILIAIIGLILGFIGVYKYPYKSTGWTLSLISIIIAVVNMAVATFLY